MSVWLSTTAVLPPPPTPHPPTLLFHNFIEIDQKCEQKMLRGKKKKNNNTKNQNVITLLTLLMRCWQIQQCVMKALVNLQHSVEFLSSRRTANICWWMFYNPIRKTDVLCTQQQQMGTEGETQSVTNTLSRSPLLPLLPSPSALRPSQTCTQTPFLHLHVVEYNDYSWLWAVTRFFFWNTVQMRNLVYLFALGDLKQQGQHCLVFA